MAPEDVEQFFTRDGTGLLNLPLPARAGTKRRPSMAHVERPQVVIIGGLSSTDHR
jgi:hypothetical protein